MAYRVISYPMSTERDDKEGFRSYLRARQWCHGHISGKWFSMPVQGPDDRLWFVTENQGSKNLKVNYVFWFDSEQDLMLFTLAIEGSS